MRCLVKKIVAIKKTKQNLKYWHQSTSNEMKNNQTKHPASDSNENPDYFVIVTRFIHMVVLLIITDIKFNFCFRQRNTN